MLFSGPAAGRGGSAISSKNLPVWVRKRVHRQQSTGQFAQDCQRRHSQASRAPVWLTVCFLMKNME
jgi:hypothetical protein